MTPLVINAQDLSEENQFKLNEIENLKKDNDYWALLKARAELNTMLLYNEVDMDGISKLDFNPYDSHCDIPKTLAEDIRGGFDYLRISCLIDTMRNQVHKKYDSLIKTLSKEEKITLFHKPARAEIDYDLLIERNRTGER